MKYRKKMSKGRSRKMFSKTAKRVHKKNGRGRPMLDPAAGMVDHVELAGAVAGVEVIGDF